MQMLLCVVLLLTTVPSCGYASNRSSECDNHTSPTVCVQQPECPHWTKTLLCTATARQSTRADCDTHHGDKWFDTDEWLYRVMSLWGCHREATLEGYCCMIAVFLVGWCWTSGVK